MRILLQTIIIFLAVTSGFVVLNNIPQIPWSIMSLLWYAWIPSIAAAAAFCYGLSPSRSGGSIFIAALLLTPIILLSNVYQLPFATTITFLPSIIAALLLPIPMEIFGRSLQTAHKKSTCSK